jgi:hypothetical protein
MEKLKAIEDKFSSIIQDKISRFFDGSSYR